jgi:hypothetical protein
MKHETYTSCVCATCSETKNCRIEEALLSVEDPDNGKYYSNQIGCNLHIWPKSEYYDRMFKEGKIPDKAYKTERLLND